jgi:hypothetical protein
MYGKLFAQMYDGTLATKGPWQALATFQQLIILADKHGTVDMTADAIARRTTFPLEVIQLGLSELEKPDPDSRTPDEEGRRIVRLSDSRPWGWQIVNHAHYRALRSEDERRDYHRKYYRDKRSPKAKGEGLSIAPQPHSTPSSTNSTNSTHYTDAVSSKQDAINPRGDFQKDFKARGFKILQEIVEHRVEVRTPNGPRSHIPKDFIDSLPRPAQVAFNSIGGSAAILDAKDETAKRVLRSQFASIYASECQDLPVEAATVTGPVRSTRINASDGKLQQLVPTQHGDRWQNTGSA